MKRHLYRILLSASICIFSFSANALDTPYFSGYAGILGDITGDPNSEAFKPDLQAQTFFEGQLDFSGKVILRSEFYLSTENLLSTNIFEEPVTNNAKFRIQEVSATAKVNALTFTNYFSAFLGNFEPIGSDIYLQRQFGIKSITSRITESWHGVAGASIYPFYGLGGSYTLRFEQPMALGINIYGSQSLADIIAGNPPDDAVNFDVRYACIAPYFAMDLCAGLGLHIEKEDSAGEKVFVLVKEADFHAGTIMLIGNRYTTSLFLQAGIGEINLNVDKTNDFKLSNLYFLLEPRFMNPAFQFNFALFNIPANATSDMIYLKDFNATTNVLGANICFVTDRLYIGNTNITFGIHTTYGINDVQSFTDLQGFLTLISNMHLNVTPFLTVPVFGGNFSIQTNVDCFKLTTATSNAFKISCGFKTAL